MTPKFVDLETYHEYTEAIVVSVWIHGFYFFHDIHVITLPSKCYKGYVVAGFFSMVKAVPVTRALDIGTASDI